MEKNSPENRPRRKGVQYSRDVGESKGEDGKTTAVKKTEKKKKQGKEGAKKAVEGELAGGRKEDGMNDDSSKLLLSEILVSH